eukprot:7181394-Pyramimonas_sp.AAC.1
MCIRDSSLDWAHGAVEDHLRPAFLRVVKGWITSNALYGVFLGTPCTSWSRAVRIGLRTSREPMGTPDLSERHQRM